jgi:hypothetical protein
VRNLAPWRALGCIRGVSVSFRLIGCTRGV